MSEQLTIQAFSSIEPLKQPFRTIHYLGSKLRVLDEIKKIVDEIDIEKSSGICDIFAGSGAISQFFAPERKIVAVDIQYYSFVILNVLLKPSGFHSSFEKENVLENLLNYKKIISPLIEFENELINGKLSSDLELVCNFLENSSLYAALNENINDCSSLLQTAFKNCIENINQSKESFFLATKYFGGVYFSYDQAVTIDALLTEIRNIDGEYRYLYLAALLSTASDIVNTVGKQFAQPIRPRNKNGKPKSGILKQLRKDRNLDVRGIYQEWLNKYASISKYNIQHKVWRMDYREALLKLDDDVNIIYADPPYTRDHYSRFYHALETLSLMDFPTISTTNIGGVRKLSRGLYREEREQSDFCIKSKAPKAFEELFKIISEKNKILLLSYSPYDKDKNSHPRVVELDFLANLAKKYFKNVEIKSLGKFSHNKLNKVELHLHAENFAEVLIICKN